MTFDTKLFAERLGKAKGDRSINKYASDADVSPAHISRLLRGLLTTPPSPETIRKLALVAYNEVSYEEMMQAAGHIQANNENAAEETMLLNKLPSIAEKKFVQILISELYECDFEWSFNKPKHGFPDLIIDIRNSQYTKWYIEFKSFSHSHSYTSASFIYQIFGQIALLEFTPDRKFTIAVDTTAAYEELIRNAPKSLRVDLYAMLVDLEAGKIIKEEQLCHY